MTDRRDDMPDSPVGEAGEAGGAKALAPKPQGMEGEILLPGTETEQRRQEAKVRRGFFSTLKRAIRHIPFAEDVVASYYCALDRQTPAASRGILLAALAYFVLPFDAIPDFVAGLGYTDDAAVLLAALAAVRNNIRPEHYDRAREALKSKQAGEAPGEASAGATPDEA